MNNRMYTEQWEKSLDLQFFHESQTKKRAYICSPLHDESEEGFLFNLYAARAYMLYASREMGYVVRAPHGYLPLILNDDNPEERSLALDFGLKLLEHSDVLLVCGNRLSSGMSGEIIRAAELGKSIFVFHEVLFFEVQKLLQTKKILGSPIFIRDHRVLAHPRPQTLY